MTPPGGIVYRTATPKFLTIQAFAQHFGVSYMTVRRLIENEEVRAIRVGRSVRIPEAEVARFRQANMIGGAA